MTDYGANAVATVRSDGAGDGFPHEATLLKKACETARVGGWHVDLESRRVFWTAMTRRLYEVPEDYVPDLTACLQFFPGEARRNLRQALERAGREGAAFDLELPFRTFAGRRRWVRCSGRAQAGGRRRGVWGTLQDLTEVKRLQDACALRAALLDGVEEAVLATDLAGRIVYANAAACRIWGQALPGRPVTEGGPENSGPIWPAEVLETTLERNEWCGTVDAPGPRGRSVTFACRTFLVSDGSGRPTGVAGTGRVLGASPSAAFSPATEPEAPAEAAGRRTIVVVDDEPGVRALAGGVLSRQGYRVWTAASGAECLDRIGGAEAPVDLLLTDVLMPDMNGVDLWNALAERFPHVQALFMSGYAAADLVALGIVVEDERCLQKPFSVKDLAARVQAMLAAD